MTFTLPKYADIIGMSRELKDAALAPIRARQARVRFDAAVAEQEEKLVNAETKISELAAQHPLDVERLINALDDRALIERRIKVITKIRTQLFPED